MKAIGEMSLQELAAFVCSHLQQHDIPVVLVGGSCVSTREGMMEKFREFQAMLEG